MVEDPFHSAELAAPDLEGVLEQAAAGEVLDQRRRGLVCLAVRGLDASHQTAVLLPGLGKD